VYFKLSRSYQQIEFFSQVCQCEGSSTKKEARRKNHGVEEAQEHYFRDTLDGDTKIE
jgi:hypothetical protein